MYGIADFGRMIDDEARMGAFRKALAATIDANTVVLDLGAGTGIMALLACRYGAKRVYAVEPSDALQVARETAAKNDLSDRIVCFQQRSSVVTLPERVDLIQRIVREHHGRIGLESHVGQGTIFRIWLPLHERRIRLLHQGEDEPRASGHD